MTGGLIQLVAYGIQDIYLTDDPQITFFKIVYRRHTNFSIETIPQFFTHKPDFGLKVSCILSRSGDLLRKLYVVATLPRIPKFVDSDAKEDRLTKFAWVRRIGFALIRSVEIEIGGQLVDRHYGEWLHIWDELAGAVDHERGIDNMIGDVNVLKEYTNGKRQYKLFIPLQFWFNRNTGTALPMVSLQYSEVKINLEIQNVEKCILINPRHYIQLHDDIAHYTPFEYIEQTVNGITAIGQVIDFDSTTQRLYYTRISRNKFLGSVEELSTNIAEANQPYLIKGLTSKYEGMPEVRVVEHNHRFIPLRNINLKECFLLAEYVFLDEEERVRFAQSKHEYLMEHLQFDGEKQIDSSNRRFKLGFKHPAKEIIFVNQLDFLTDNQNNDLFNYTDSYIYEQNRQIGKNIIREATITLNGHERLSFRPSEYFNWVQTYQHHSHASSEGINLYSFALYPEKYQPGGTANMSKIDDIALRVTVDNSITFQNLAKLRVYAVAYNVLRVANGLGGLVFT